MEVHSYVSEYTLSVLPDDDVNEYLYAISVHRARQMDGTELWAVRWMGRCLNRRLGWDYEPIPSSRTKRWLATHRFPLDEAMRLARAAVPDITVNGRRARDLVGGGV